MDLRPASERVFATPELFEYILSWLLTDAHPVGYGEDPRSFTTYDNCALLLHLLRCSEVNQVWYQCMKGSKNLQRNLFLHPEQRPGRSWDVVTMSDNAPVLNPIIQTIFSTYHFRYWHLSLEASGNKYCAYLIITRRDLPNIASRLKSGQGRTISRMVLSQPPCTVLEATIWEEKDETKDYVGRTAVLKNPRIVCEDGLTLGIVHERVQQMLSGHPDVAAIKLTTV
ncbi:hypothetical protein LTR17_004257 [Elasticomyces elasticus]|nr:hypothetical protein LTR17_004257 [Elasticomyces elasticus]